MAEYSMDKRKKHRFSEQEAGEDDKL